MKIVDLRITSVNVPVRSHVLRWACGVETGTTRGIIEVVTEDGIVGLGETYGGAGIEHAIETARPFVIGLDALDIGKLMHRFAVFCIGYETPVPTVVRAGIEMACLDAAGKSLGLPVYRLLGGGTRDRIEFGAYVSLPLPRSEDRHWRRGLAAGHRRAHPRALRLGTAFCAIKLKGGVYRPAGREFKALELIRTDFLDAPLRCGPECRVVGGNLDPHRTPRLMASGIDLEYLEDPTATLEGMSQVRNAVSIPLATNMCLVAWDQLRTGHPLHAQAVDVILSDLHYWGGFQQNRKDDRGRRGLQSRHRHAAADRELGISTSAMLHPRRRHALHNLCAVDSHYHDQLDDLITEPFVYENGCMRVPDGPGPRCRA